MKYHLLLSILVLIFLSQCSLVSSPEADLEKSNSGEPEKSPTAPELQQPENSAKNQKLSPVLSWEEISGEVSYQVQLSSSDTFSDTLANPKTDSSEYQISGLSPETTYYWKVRAINEDSVQGPWSEAWNFTTNSKSENTKPVSTSLKTPADGSDGLSPDIKFKWSEVVYSKGYRVQLATASDFSKIISDTITSSVNYQINDISYNTTYYWRVRPQLDNKETRWTDAWKFKTRPESQEPVTTTHTAPSNGAADQATSLTMKWKEVSQANSYRVQVHTEDNFSSPQTDQTVQSTSLSLSGLDNETNYYWRVFPKTNEGNGKWSEVWSFKTEAATDDNGDGGTANKSDMWVSAYLASYNHYAPPGGNWGNLPTEEIDWDAFTHLFYFSLKAKSDGTLSTIAQYQNMSPSRINAIVSAAHEHEKPVIITIGGWGNYDGFSSAISPAVRSVFITNLVALIKTWGFDGIDLDMEPIKDSDVSNYKAFVQELSTALDKITTPLGNKPLLTAATVNQPDMFSDIHDHFDQINLMTYDYSGAWDGWVSWHNSALYDGGLKFPKKSKSLPSIDGSIKQFTDAGIPKSKLGIGIDFYGYVWNGGSGTSTGGVTEPNQSWTTAPTVTDNVPYHEIMDKYHSNDTYRWDNQAKAPYLSIDQADDNADKFISYDDSKTIKEKINYIRQQQLGGTIIWELSGGYRKNLPEGSRDKLLQTVKNNIW